MKVQNQPVTIANGKGREEQLQFLRFLAFLNVFVTHAEQWLFFPYRATFSALASVSFFFMLSGLVAGYSLAGKTVVPSFGNIAGFLWKKIRKVYPLYFLTTMFAVMFSEIPLLVTQCDFAGLRPLLLQLGRNLLLIQSWFPGTAHSFNTVGWFLSVLVFHYAMTLPLAWMLNKLNSGKFRNLLFAGLFMGISVGIVFYCYTIRGDRMSFWHNQFPPARLGEYCLGMIMGFVARREKKRLPQGKFWRIVFTVLEIAVLLFWYYSLSRPGNYWRHKTVSWLIPNVLVLAVYLAGQGWLSSLFRRKELVYLGDISFECYLLHQLILMRFAINLSGAEPSVPGNVFVFLFSLLFSILMAGYIHGKRMHEKGKG